MGGSAALDPLVGLNDATKPLRSKLLAVPALPAGLTFSTVTGELSGTPTASGIFTFGVRAAATTRGWFAKPR